MARPRKDEGRDTRRDILDRALDLFAAHGFAGTSMRDIARAVGVGESALYHHFVAKDAILEALLGELGPGSAAQIVNPELLAMMATLEPREVLHRVVDVLLGIFAQEKERKIFRVMMGEGARRAVDDPFHPATFMTAARAKIALLFASLVERGAVRPVDPAAATLAFMAPMMLIRITYLLRLDGPPDLKGARAEAHRHVDFLWSALEPLPPPTAHKPNARSGKKVR